MKETNDYDIMGKLNRKLIRLLHEGEKDMDLYVNEQKIDSIKAFVEKKMKHHFLSRNIQFPQIDKDRILILAMAMKDRDIPDGKSDRYISSAMLVQAALDTHEKVTDPLASLQERQLTVLAGDYFSGLYYRLLAEHENVGLIRTLALAIKLVNEYKVSLYRFEMDDLDAFLQHIKKVETAVIEQFCRHFGSIRYTSLFNEWLFYKRLLTEWEAYKRGGDSILFNGIKKFAADDQNGRDQNVEQIFNTYLDTCKQNLLEAVRSVGTLPSILHSRIADLTSGHHFAT